MGGQRWRLQLIIAAVALAVIAWIAFYAAPRATTIVPDYGGTYVEAVVGQPKFVNPILALPDSIDSDLAALVFSGLTRVDDKGEILPDLGVRWTVSGDNRTYVFTLRDDVRWQDGAPLDAQDVLFTVQAMRDPNFQGPPEIAQLWRTIAVDAPDSRTVRFQLPDAYAPFLEFASVGILPAHLLRGVAAKDLPAQPFNARPVGTGRYRLKAVSRDEIVLEANPDYYGTRPFLSTLRFRFFADNARAIDALTKQDVESVRKLPAEEHGGVRSLKNVSSYSSPDLSKLTLLLFNTRVGLASDKAVRQAIARAIDRFALVDAVLGGHGLLADGPIAPDSWAYYSEPPMNQHRPDSVKALLEEDGWSQDAAGWSKGTDRLSLVLLTNDNPLRVQSAQQIARQLGAVGINVDVQSAGWSGFVQDFLVPRRFQMALTEQWSPNADPDPYAFWHSSQIATGLNFASWTSRRADEVLENARRSNEMAVRRPLYEEFQRIFADELPAVPLYYPTFDFAVDRVVQGIHPRSLIVSSDRFRHVDEWFVKTKIVPR